MLTAQSVRINNRFVRKWVRKAPDEATQERLADHLRMVSRGLDRLRGKPAYWHLVASESCYLLMTMLLCYSWNARD